MKKYIEEMIKDYTGRSLSPWHMPGHKRKPLFGGFWDDAFSRDLTEVPGTDDYHHPEGAIHDSQVAAAKVYGTVYSHYLVGGTTAGILAGILALTELFRKKTGLGDGEEPFETGKEEPPVFMIAGNVHRSVHHALRLAGAKNITLEPEGDPYYGPVMPEEVEKALERLKESGEISGVAGCVITSPTYGGAISPLVEIHRILEKEEIPLFVDEAHGAHLPFIPELSGFSGISAGAELVVQSLHKTLPALTQTGIIHVGKGVGENDLEEDQSSKNEAFSERLERELSRQLSVVQSSSPSYILLASAEQAVAWADEERKGFGHYLERVLEFRKIVSREIEGLELKDFPWKQDPTRLFLHLSSRAGTEEGSSKSLSESLSASSREGSEEGASSVKMLRIADDLEKEDGIVVELAGPSELILISTVADQNEDFEKLLSALKRIDVKLREGLFGRNIREDYDEDHFNNDDKKNVKDIRNDIRNDIWNDIWKEDPDPDTYRRIIPQIGTTAENDVYVYPPGILILRSGDPVTEEAVGRIYRELSAGRTVRGL